MSIASNKRFGETTRLTQMGPFKAGVAVAVVLIAIASICAIHPVSRAWLLSTKINVGLGLLTIGLPVTVSFLSIPLIIFLRRKMRHLSLKEGAVELTTSNPKQKKNLKIVAGVALGALIIGCTLAVCLSSTVQHFIFHKMSLAEHLLIIGLPAFVLGGGFNLAFLLFHRHKEKMQSDQIQKMYDESDNEMSTEK